MNFSGSAPVRQPVIEPPEKDSPGILAPPERPEASDQSVAQLRLLWGYRGLLCRVAVYAMLASALLAFLIPSRYECTVRLMPPDNPSTSGLAMAAAAMSGNAEANNSANVCTFGKSDVNMLSKVAAAASVANSRPRASPCSR